MVDPQQSAQLCPDVRSKLGPPVGRDGGGDAEPGNPPSCEGVGDGGRLHILQRDRFQPAGRTVDHGELVFLTGNCLGKGPHQVHMNMGETVRWYWYRLDRRRRLDGDLPALAPLAIPAPQRDIF